MSKKTKPAGRRKKAVHIRPEFKRLKRYIAGLFVLVIVTLPAVSAEAGKELIWRRSDTGIPDSRIRTICVIKNAPNVLYAGSVKAIYKSIDYGKSWYRVLALRSTRKKINSIIYDASNSYKIFAATDSGLYISADGGRKWQRRFRGRDREQRSVTCIAVDANKPGSVFIGTKRGLFESGDGARRWQAHNSLINKRISSIAVGSKGVYVCAEDGVYYKKSDSSIWERIYIAGISAKEDNSADSNSDGYNGAAAKNETGGLNHIYYYKQSVYLATDRGLYVLKDGARDWMPFNSQGLLSQEIRDVLASEEGVFCVTDKGVYFYDPGEKAWKDMSGGLSTADINMIDVASGVNLIFSATAKGVYRLALDSMLFDDKESIDYSALKELIKSEPAILDLQRAAIEYAEVSPDKIIWMRKAARKKAWFPTVSAGLDGDVYRTLDLDRGSTTIPDFYIEGPKDKNWGWDIDLSWDLGDIIWNDDQTSIDVRSRLMVQLRNDILDEVNKLYFERRRLQVEFYANPPKDKKQKFLKELRYQELTASLDGLTGGYLSKRIKQNR